ncbi:unnamed protein product [Brugia pahangi]|uniref:DDE Tnp4 domain-containing protein n=1 Tax=Brugia pahangi TaxID=6280 RepID=A0A0N4TE11_BRUPA|nr:unnamed protein product [Brugia pahangi]
MEENEKEEDIKDSDECDMISDSVLSFINDIKDRIKVDLINDREDILLTVLPPTNDVSPDEWDIGKQVYFNDVIMRKVVSFVNDIKDRQNLELSSIAMNDLSSRVPYISYNNDNSILDMYFTRIEPVMNISVAGNDFKVMAITSSVRRTCVDNPISQSNTCILKMQHIIRRFSRQIRRLHIGGISDFERRLGYIPDHQLLLTLLAYSTDCWNTK